MADDRQLARDLLSGRVSVSDVARMRRTTVSPPPVQSTEATAPPPVPPGETPEAKPPVLTQAPETGRKFPCEKCGARLDFDPAARALKCPYCGHEEKIEPSREGAGERDYTQALSKIPHDQGTIEGRSSEVRCPGCGAMVLMEDNVETERCPFCATHLINAPRTKAAEMIRPDGLLAFKVSQRQAVEAFTRWLQGLWFAPTKLRVLATLGQLSGVYVPYWTYDSMTYSHYTGQRGDDYWETQHYTDSQGKRQTRQVRKTRWRYVSGEVDHFFDDVLVCASRSLPGNLVEAVEPWDLGRMEAFKPEYLAGFRTERYVVTLPEGFAAARQIMDGEIRALCRRDIGGDHQRITTLRTQHVGVTYKHILLPMWLAVYRYQGQTYRILVNARTGEVQGARPWSWIKITFAVVLGLIVAGIVAGLIAYFNSR